MSKLRTCMGAYLEPVRGRRDESRRADEAGHRHDAERDAWLREALRHAPDASAAPPAALREAILAAGARGHGSAAPRRDVRAARRDARAR